MPGHNEPYREQTAGYPSTFTGEKVDGYGYMRGWGTTVGNGAEGWAPGAFFTEVDTGAVYVNAGTGTTALWEPLPTINGLFDKVSTSGDDFNPRRYQYTETLNSGTISHTGASLKLTTTNVDNEATYLVTVGPAVDVVSGGSYDFEFYTRIKQNGTDTDHNYAVGLINADDVGDDILADDGAGPPANWGGAMFYKVDGSDNWAFEYSRATSQNTQTMGAGSTSDYIDFRIVNKSNVLTPSFRKAGPNYDWTVGDPVTIVIGADNYWSPFAFIKTGATEAQVLTWEYWKCLFNYRTGRFSDEP